VGLGPVATGSPWPAAPRRPRSGLRGGGGRFLPCRCGTRSTSLGARPAPAPLRQPRRPGPRPQGRAHGVTLLAASGLGPRPAVVVNRGVSFPLDLLNRWKYHHPRVGRWCAWPRPSGRWSCAPAGCDRNGGDHPRRHDTGRFDPDRVSPGTVARSWASPPINWWVAQVSVRDWKGWRRAARAFARLAPRHPLAASSWWAASRSRSGTRSWPRPPPRRGRGGPHPPLSSRHAEVLAACDLVADASWAGTGITAPSARGWPWHEGCRQRLRRQPGAGHPRADGLLCRRGTSTLWPRRWAAGRRPELRRRLGRAARSRWWRSSPSRSASTARGALRGLVAGGR